MSVFKELITPFCFDTKVTAQLRTWNLVKNYEWNFRPKIRGNIGETGRSMHERIKEHDRDIRLARTQTSAVSEHAHKTGHYPLWNELKFIDRDPHWYTRRVKEDFTLITSTGIAEFKFPNSGCPRSRNTTGKRYNNGPLREQLLARRVRIEMHQSQPTSVI